MIAAYRDPDPAARPTAHAASSTSARGVPAALTELRTPRPDPEPARRRRPGLLRPARHQQRPHRSPQRPPRTPPRLRPRVPQPHQLHRPQPPRDRRLQILAGQLRSAAPTRSAATRPESARSGTTRTPATRPRTPRAHPARVPRSAPCAGPPSTSPLSGYCAGRPQRERGGSRGSNNSHSASVRSCRRAASIVGTEAS
jgi:hypothetical protein